MIRNLTEFKNTSPESSNLQITASWLLDSIRVSKLYSVLSSRKPPFALAEVKWGKMSRYSHRCRDKKATDSRAMPVEVPPHFHPLYTRE